MVYLKIFFIILWFEFICFLGVMKGLFHYKDEDINKFTGWHFGSGALKIAGIKVEKLGLENYETHEPCIYVGNHQSAMDAIIYGYLFPRKTIAIGKREIRWIPFFGRIFKMSGNILIDRKNKTHSISGLNEATQSVKTKKVSVIIFPEGTRNRSGEGLLPFKKGAFHMSLETDAPIVPILCSPLGPLVNWKKRKLLAGTIQIKVLPPIYPQGDLNTFKEKVREIMLAELGKLETKIDNPSQC